MQALLQRPGQDSGAVLVAFALAHRDGVQGEIDILYPQRDALLQAQPAAVQYFNHQFGGAGHMRQNRLHLLMSKNRGQAARGPGVIE